MRPSGDRRVPGGLGADAGTHRPSMGQGRLRRSRARQIRPSRARNAHGFAEVVHAADRRRNHGKRREAPRASQPSPRRPSRLRPAPSGRHGRRLPSRIARPDGHSSAPAPRMLLRHRHRGGPHPPRPYPGRRRQPLPGKAPGPRTCHVSASLDQAGPGKNPRSPALPGTAHANSDRRRRFHPGPSRSAAQSDGRETLARTHVRAQKRAVFGDGRQGRALGRPRGNL